jgi:hypothetical protein
MCPPKRPPPCRRLAFATGSAAQAVGEHTAANLPAEVRPTDQMAFGDEAGAEFVRGIRGTTPGTEVRRSRFFIVIRGHRGRVYRSS